MTKYNGLTTLKFACLLLVATLASGCGGDFPMEGFGPDGLNMGGFDFPKLDMGDIDFNKIGSSLQDIANELKLDITIPKFPI